MMLVHVDEHSGDARGAVRAGWRDAHPRPCLGPRRLAVLLLFGCTADGLFGFNVLIGNSVYAVACCSSGAGPAAR